MTGECHGDWPMVALFERPPEDQIEGFVLCAQMADNHSPYCVDPEKCDPTCVCPGYEADDAVA